MARIKAGLIFGGTLSLPELWKHQKEAIARAQDAAEFALLFDLGTGKTRTAIEILRAKFNKHGIMRTLILCPLVVMRNWRDEILKYSKIPESEILIPSGSGREKTESIKKTQAHIIILNYDALIRDELHDALFEWCPEILICDESHRLKNITAKRTKKTIELADRTVYRYILTGTPILNGPMDIFSQFRVLDGGATFGRNFYSFRHKFFYDLHAFMPKQRHFPKWRIKDRAAEELNKLIYTKAMRVKKEEALDLPPLIKQTILVEMSPEQKRLYESMKKDFIAFVQNSGTSQVSVAELAVTKALRLLQICSGFIKLEDGSEISLKDTPKIDALRDLLEELTPSHKVIIWAVFKQNYRAIGDLLTELGLEYAELHGGVSEKQKAQALDSFKKDERVRVMLAHPGSGGIGVSMVEAPYAIYYSRGFSLEFDLQSEARNHRGGSEIHDKITRIDLVCENTLDDLVKKALAEKQEVGESLLRTWVLEANLEG